MLIRDMENFPAVRQYKVDVVTVDGDQRNAKGVLTGGFLNAKVTIYNKHNHNG